MNPLCSFRLWILASGAMLSGCNLAVAPIRPFAGHETWRKTDPANLGRFSSSPRLEFIAPNNFLFTQPENDSEKFCFHSPAHGIITPETMVTSGSSVPRYLWPVKSLGPWDFARSAVIHDWIFEAHHRYHIAGEALRAAQAVGNLPAMQRAEADRKRYAQWGGDDKFEAAADIMAECIREEMRFCRRGGDVIQGQLKAPVDAGGSLYVGETEKALKETAKDFRIGTESRSTLGFYRWAIGSYFARKVWSPSGGHRSSITTVRALKDHVDEATRHGFIDKRVQTVLMDLVRSEEKREEPVGLENLAKSLQKEQKSQSKDLREIIRRVENGETLNIGGVFGKASAEKAKPMLQTLAVQLDAYARKEHIVSESSLPALVSEVRYYYTEDRAEAEGIRQRIITLTGMLGGSIRISYVIDRDIKARHTYQIALARGSLVGSSPAATTAAP